MNTPRMVDCAEPATISRGRAVACHAHQLELATASAHRQYPGSVEVAPLGAVCGQHLRLPDTFEDIGDRIDVVTDQLHDASTRRLTPAGLAAVRARAAEVTTLLQALVGTAEADYAAAAADEDTDGYDQFLADLAPGGER